MGNAKRNVLVEGEVSITLFMSYLFFCIFVSHILNTPKDNLVAPWVTKSCNYATLVSSMRRIIVTSK